MVSSRKRRATPEPKKKKSIEVVKPASPVSWTSEVFAFLYAAMSGFLFFSICTHAIKVDQVSGASSSYNLMGPAGYFTATMLKAIFGWSSLSMAFLLAALAVYFWLSASNQEKKFLGSWYVLSGGMLSAILCLAGIASAVVEHQGGGEVGDFISTQLSAFFGYYGTLVTLAVVLLFSMAIALQRSTIWIVKQSFFLCIGILKFTYLLVRKAFLKVWESAASRTASTLDARTYAKDIGVPIPKPKIRKNKLLADQISLEIEEVSEPEMTHIVVERRTAKDKDKKKAKITRNFDDYVLPDIDLLEPGEVSANVEDDEALRKKSRLIEDKLKDFGVTGRVTHVHPGPVITLFEFEPAAGVKVGKVAALQDDLAMSLKATAIRIIAPIPKRGTVGIEVPNTHREVVRLRDIIESPDFATQDSVLSIALGKDVYGVPVVVDVAQMPHLLMAGSTGTGKSVSINTILLSLLFRSTPAELGLILIDPKILELSAYEGIPHLKVPVVTVPKQAKAVLSWAVHEMDRRYKLMQAYGVRNIDGYNKVVRGEEVDEQESLDVEQVETVDLGVPKEELKPLPKIVIVVDELADLMLSVGREIEDLIARLAQKARAAGIHLILATQRPSVDVITGLIKANFPARLSFRVSSRIDSRTILDSMGAEKLLGRGDMLLMLPNDHHLRRVHGAFVSDEEVIDVVSAIKTQSSPNYDNEIMSACEKALQEDDQSEDDRSVEYDELYDQSVQLVVDKGYASTSMLQRAFRIGYNRAARIIDTMEKEGVIGPMDGARPREVLISTDT